jgi:hypothetical protein
MHPPCFGKFPYSVGKFSKATPVLESCYVVFWKVFKSYTGLGKLLRGVLESFQKLHPHVSTMVLFSFLEDGRCIPPILVDYKSMFWVS